MSIRFSNFNKKFYIRFAVAKARLVVFSVLFPASAVSMSVLPLCHLSVELFLKKGGEK